VIAVGDRIKRTFARHVEAAGNFEQFVDFARATLANATSSRRNTLITDQVVYHYEEREKLLELLKEHICQNLVSVGGKLFKQGAVSFFRQKFTLEDAIGSHGCSLQANMRVTNGIPLECSLLLPVDTANWVRPLKVKGLHKGRC
jgi:hypothetical protein